MRTKKSQSVFCRPAKQFFVWDIHRLSAGQLAGQNFVVQPQKSPGQRVDVQWLSFIGKLPTSFMGCPVRFPKRINFFT
jgi:hypothetical protein